MNGNVIFNQDIITDENGNAQYNPDFLDSVTAEENDPDHDIVMQGIAQIANIFNDVDDIRENHETVKSILRHAGFNDWWTFYEQHEEDINAAFNKINKKHTEHVDPNPSVLSLANAPTLTRSTDLAFLTAYANAAKKMLANLTRDKTNLVKDAKELDEEITSANLKLKEIADRLIEIAPIRANSKKSEECEKLEKLHDRIKDRVPKLHQEKAILVKKRDAILAQSDLTTAQLTLLNNNGPNPIANIASGDFTTDADTYSAVAKNCCFRIGYGLHALCNMRTRQYHENAESNGRYSIREMMDTGGGVYDNDSLEKRISKAEAEINRLTILYAACAIQYHLLSSYPRNPSAYWPKFDDDFWASICISRQRAIVSTTKKRDDLRAAEEDMAQRGAWRIPAM